jgi:hypothetical protein
VLVRWLAIPLSVLVPVLVGCGSDEGGSTTSTPAVKAGKARGIAGDWTGRLHQEGLAPFRIAVRIDPSGVGQVAYTGIDCAGGWEPRGLMGSQSHFYDFTERINRGAGGKCKGIGRVNTYLDATTGEERLHYRFSGGGVTSRGTLHRTDSSGLKPVFDEAGVTPP